MTEVQDSNPNSSFTANQPSSGGVAPPWIVNPATNQTQRVEEPMAVVKEANPAGVVRKSPFAILTPLLILLVLGGTLFLLGKKVILPLVQKLKSNQATPGQTGEKITLNYWGLWEAKEIMQPVIDDYQKDHSNVTVQYTQQSYKDYRERLQSALASGQGPDVFRLHSTWLPMLKKELAPASEETAKKINLEENFYPVISHSLKVGSQVFGVPLGFDTLALFYNQKIFSQAGKTYPTTWDELRRTAAQLCVAETKDKTCKPGEKILTAGVALGTASNVDHFSDILGLMMLQNGVDLTNPTGALTEDALKFYTFFVTTDGVWNETLPPSVNAFAQGKVAMILAPSWRVHDIKQINPKLEFKTAPVPQLPGTKIAWASFWAEGVSAQSKNAQAAWDFLAYLSTKDVLTKLYSQASKVRSFGEPYPRLDLASQLEDDPLVGAFVKQGPWAQIWYLCSNTFDNGVNDKMIKYFEDAVNKVIKGEGVTSSLQPVAQGVTQILTQYGIK